jgi:hypothetical protein
VRRVLVASMVLAWCLPAVSCSGPAGPTSSETLEQFVQALRQQGLSVTVAGQIAPEVNRFFSVPARELRVGNGQLNAFVYDSAEAAAGEAALISDGQPSPTVRILWVSTPRFYRQDALIVLYVGCDTEIVRALQATVGTPISVGRNPCTIPA